MNSVCEAVDICRTKALETYIKKMYNSETKLNGIDMAKAYGFSDKLLPYFEEFWDMLGEDTKGTDNYNNAWFLLMPNRVKGILTKETSKIFMRNFHDQILKKMYIEHQEYKEATREEINAYERCLKISTTNKVANNAKIYWVTGRTYKKLLMKSKTSKGMEIADYFIEIEDFAKKIASMITHITRKQAREREHQLLEAKEQAERSLEEERKANITLTAEQSFLSTMLQNIREFELDEFIYVLTTQDMKRQSLFKVGRTHNLQARLSFYRTAHPTNTEIGYVYTTSTNRAQLIENIFRHINKDFRDRKIEFKTQLTDSMKEIYKLPGRHIVNQLESIVQGINKAIAGHNYFISHLTNNICLPSELTGELPFIGEHKAIEAPPNDRIDLTKLVISTIDALYKDDPNSTYRIVVNAINKYIGSDIEIKRTTEQRYPLIKWLDIQNIIKTNLARSTGYRSKVFGLMFNYVTASSDWFSVVHKART
jgi:phage anti-repressor protein